MKTILITGGTKGIGKAISLRLAKANYNVALNYHSDEITANETLMECKNDNSNVILIKTDVSKIKEVNEMFSKVVDLFGSIDVVINNAGINIDKPVMDMSEDEWDRVVDVNMKGVFLVSQTAAKFMLKQNQPGQIINVSATTAIAGRKNGINYCASKAGVIVMTKCLAKELGPKIRVNCVIPGITRTKEIEDRFNLKENEQFEVSKRGIPLNRVGEPFEIANIINFLISEEASYLNGQKIIIDGGEYMY
jgi:NAD(P)-dependent dehydrogenase (short-subunit alcohol dehydrogenase family)